MSTFKDIVGIKISSEYFNNSPTFNLFTQENDRIAMVFGRNGSGKSTISQSFVEYAGAFSPRTVSLDLLTRDGSLYISPIGRPAKIFVFNEDYINDNVKFKSDGLDTIVLLGEQVDISDKIDSTENSIEELVERREVLESKLSEYKDKKNSKSPDFWIEKIKKTLHNGWAETQGIKINKKQKRSSVTLDTIETIMGKKPKESKADIQEKFESKMTVFDSTDSESVPIYQVASNLVFNKNILKDSQDSLNRTVSKPSLTDREAELLSLFGIDTLTNAKEYITQNVNKICPKCLNVITAEHKDKIVEEINRIISRESEEFQNELEGLILTEIQVAEYDVFKPLDKHLYAELVSAISLLNTDIIKHNELINDKISNPFEVLSYSLDDITELYKSVNNLLSQIEQKRQNYNKAISDRKSLIEELTKLNYKLAYFDIKEEYKQYKTVFGEAETIIEELKKANDSLRVYREELERLNAERQNLKLAADSLNKELQYIFYSSKRLSLTPDDATKTYKLKVNGRAVKPSKISSGERNALALCYFFADIANNMQADNPYSEPMFLVIDDPVSSFDFENKIGIMSFLKYKFKSVLSGSESTKAIIMTHDISFFMDFCKALEELSKYCESIGKQATYRPLYLHNKEIKEFKYKKQNEYTDLLTEVFEFANAESVDENNAIGNQIRRVVEAFSTFSFKVGVDELSTKKEILDLLPTQESKDYFENLMYRLVLNGESHFEDTARFFPRTDFYSHLSPEEKQRTAKDILCFMYILNKPHIKSHLKENTTVIEKWIEELSSDEQLE